MNPTTTLEEGTPIGNDIGTEPELVGGDDVIIYDAQPPAEPILGQGQPDGDDRAQHPVVVPDGEVPSCEDRPVRRRTPNIKYPSDVYNL